MSKFNKLGARRATGRGPVVAQRAAHTHEGGAGFARDLKSELFLLAVANMAGEHTFYEAAADRDSRYATLVRAAAIEDPEWTAGLLGWLRSSAHMRSASLAGAAEFVRARREAGLDGGNRQVIASVLQRADEPGELLAYWSGRYGRALPQPVKRGIGDAVRRLYTEQALLKYDTGSKGFRFGDVLELTHPKPATDAQGDLFTLALDRRHQRDDIVVPPSLPVLAANERLRAGAEADPALLCDPELLRAAGMTWEDALSRAGDRVSKRALWEALIPSMGIMALARNLRNFDDAGVSDAMARTVQARFEDAAQVARSRMFPFRWLAAYEQAPSLRWGHALDRALQASLSGLPTFGGRTLVLVDTSASMTGRGFSARSTMTPLKAAAVFGVALAAKGERTDLVGFASGTFRHRIRPGTSVIREVDAFCKRVGEVGHGTEIAKAVRTSFDGHDRVVIVSDMQTMDSHVSRAVPASVPIYAFNLGGYRVGAIDAGAPNRVELGGLTDATFRMIPLLEAGRDQNWPWIDGE